MENMMEIKPPATRQDTRCISCGGGGKQSSMHGDKYPAEPCGWCYGDCVMEGQVKSDEKRPHLSRN